MTDRFQRRMERRSKRRMKEKEQSRPWKWNVWWFHNGSPHGHGRKIPPFLPPNAVGQAVNSPYHLSTTPFYLHLHFGGFVIVDFCIFFSSFSFPSRLFLVFFRKKKRDVMCTLVAFLFHIQTISRNDNAKRTCFTIQTLLILLSSCRNLQGKY